MAATRESSGTQTATVTTEHTLATITTSKTFQLKVDISNLAAGEYVLLKLKYKTISGGTSRTTQSAIYSWLDAAINPVVTMDAMLAVGDYVATLTQMAGSSRTFDWSIETP